MRIGAVSTSTPSPWSMDWPSVPQHELVFDLPSRLADQLAAGALDVALIPRWNTSSGPITRLFPTPASAAAGRCEVKLFSRVPLPQIRTLALDEGSRTSAASCRSPAARAVWP